MQKVISPNQEDVLISFLPLAHMFERLIEVTLHACLCMCVHLVFIWFFFLKKERVLDLFYNLYKILSSIHFINAWLNVTHLNYCLVRV